MVAPENEEDKFSDWITTEVEQLLSEALEICEQNGDNARFLQRLYETWGRSMGALDALTCLRGVPQELRTHALRCSIREGRESTLEEHRRRCKGCEQGDRLERELQEMN